MRGVWVNNRRGRKVFLQVKASPKLGGLDIPGPGVEGYFVESRRAEVLSSAEGGGGEGIRKEEEISAKERQEGAGGRQQSEVSSHYRLGSKSVGIKTNQL